MTSIGQKAIHAITKHISNRIQQARVILDALRDKRLQIQRLLELYIVRINARRQMLRQLKFGQAKLGTSTLLILDIANRLMIQLYMGIATHTTSTQSTLA